MIKSIADYIIDLSKGLSKTKYAEDRPLYKSYLAEAAVMLAKAVKGADHNEMIKLIASHERLWGIHGCKMKYINMQAKVWEQ